MSEVKNISLEMRDYIASCGAETLNWCMQCGLCTSVCPWRLVPGHISENFNIRKMQRLAQLGLEGFEDEEVLFACTTCGMCQSNCTRKVKVIENVRAMRNTTVGAGFLPANLRPIVGSVHANGNPWSGEREKRNAWLEGLDVPSFTAGETEYLLYVCCTSCYDPRSQKIARAIVNLLKAAGVSFGVLGTDISCCGETMRKLGDEDLFQKLANGNITIFNQAGVKKIITTSPHCLYTFRDEYPELGGEYEVYHYSQILAEKVAEGKLKFNKEFPARVAFHDPCYLGRHSQIYDVPRQLLSAVPGVEIVELGRQREKALCCAGGGGRIWAEVPMGERFGELRVLDAVERGANYLVTACPYCIIMLEDACGTLNKTEVLTIKEMAEILNSAL